MAAALGLLTGLGLNAASGYAKEKVEQKHQHDSALFDFYSKNPQLVADSPEAQKFVTRYAGPEAGQAFIGMAGHVKQASQMFGQQVMGQGAAPTAGQPQAGGQPQPQGQPAQAQPAMTEPQHFYDLADQGEKYLASPDAQYLNDTQRKQGEEHIKYLRERGKEMESEAQKAKYESPQAKAEAAKATEQAKIDTQTSAPNVKAEAGKAATVGAARGAATKAAELGVEFSDQNVNRAADKAAKLEVAKRKAAGTAPLTPKQAEDIRNGIVTRSDKLTKQYVAEHGSAPWISGGAEYKEERAKWFFQHDPEVAVSLGLAPTVGATKLPDGNYDKGGKHLYAYKGQVYDLGSVAQ